MKYHQIDRDLFIKTETNYGSNEAKKALPFLMILSNETDSTMPFEQSRDIFTKRRIRKNIVIISGRS
jgi:hypothetical protein